MQVHPGPSPSRGRNNGVTTGHLTCPDSTVPRAASCAGSAATEILPRGRLGPQEERIRGNSGASHPSPWSLALESPLQIIQLTCPLSLEGLPLWAALPAPGAAWVRGLSLVRAFSCIGPSCEPLRLPAPALSPWNFLLEFTGPLRVALRAQTLLEQGPLLTAVSPRPGRSRRPGLRAPPTDGGRAGRGAAGGGEPEQDSAFR